jgi:CheY-like chemotaxis protein
MVHGLASQLGGTLTLSSRPGEGTRADLWLPSAVEKSASAERASLVDRAIPEIPSLSILLVDDEDLVRDATAEMLRELGHSVVTASGAEDALARLSSGLEADLVITDYMMPRMDGSEFAARIRETRPDLPVLVITGYSGSDEIASDLPSLGKPFGQADLAKAIARLIDPTGNVVRLPARS